MDPGPGSQDAFLLQNLRYKSIFLKQIQSRLVARGQEA
jgi:hypothetical protein